MREELSRTALLLGEDSINMLEGSKVAVFGVGGVGGYVVEALARSGIGAFVLIDNDTVAASNINRQIIATVDSIGRYKTEVMKERILSINPDAKVDIYNIFYLPDNADTVNLDGCNYIVDAVDTISAKLEIIIRARQYNIPVISSMGAGNKLDPTLFEVEDIYRTTVCPLARVMRRELKKRNVDSLKVVYSKEKAIEPVSINNNSSDASDSNKNNTRTKKRVPGSIAYVPSVVGLIIASEVVKDIIN